MENESFSFSQHHERIKNQFDYNSQDFSINDRNEAFNKLPELDGQLPLCFYITNTYELFLNNELSNNELCSS